MAAKSKELVVAASSSALEALRQEYPAEASFTRILLPRLGMVSQDVTEGKGKAMKVVTEAGTFFTEHQGEEEDENGKKVWNCEELGNTIEGVILFKRHQLKFYDESTDKFTSSPVYDSETDVIPLFCDKKEVAKGTPAELKALYQFTGEDGKIKSKLEENRILYVLHKDEVYQLNLRGSSMYAFMTYARKTTPNTVITVFGSEAKEKGSINWNQMTFDPKRQITNTEAEIIMEKIQEIKAGIAQEKGFYANKNATQKPVEMSEARKELEKF